MPNIKIDYEKCNLCKVCIDVCPFDAIEIVDGRIDINAACKMCRICIKNCPQNAMSIEVPKKVVNKDDYQGILVVAEFSEGNLHPVTLELLGIASSLASQVKMPVYALLTGYNTGDIPENLIRFGADKVFVYDDPELEHFRVDTYTNVLEDLINDIKPSIVLVGSTSIGRSLAPRAATRFRTGLTADCTTLKIKSNSDLIQIRPAFGGNIMAQIITTNTRPQFATVRYKVMNCIEPRDTSTGKVTRRNISPNLLKSNIEVLEVIQKDKSPSITDVDIIVAAGQGLKEKDDLAMIKNLADVLGGEFAVTRPLVEKGWADYTRQIGLSGRTVKPKLIITCGISGAIQFAACMNSSDKIIAINSDPNASIFKIAHIGIVGDIYKIVPSLIKKIEGAEKACSIIK